MHDQRSVSLWMDTAGKPAFRPLPRSLETEVCVVGAGIAGLTTAYLLAREGRQVVVLDDGVIGGGQTQRTTAHLSNALDDRYHVLEGIRGSAVARHAAESHAAAIDRIETIAAEEGIDCDFLRVDGYLFVPPGDAPGVLDLELKAVHHIGMSDVAKVDHAPLASFDTGLCLRFPRQGQFHPLSYLQGLARAVEKHGGVIHTGTRVTNVHADQTISLQTDHGTVTAWHAVLATNAPISDNAQVYSKQAPYISYVIAAEIPRGAFPPMLLWDTPDPYHYIRMQPGPGKDTDTLIIGGEDHKTGQSDDGAQRFGILEAWARRRFPEMRDIRWRWSGQVMETIDGLGLIGRKPGEDANLWIITGDSGMGMTHGTIGGMLLTDCIAGRENPWAAAYDPARAPVRAAGDFFKENANVAAQFTDYVTGGDVGDATEIENGRGAILRKGLRKIAAYRDEKGALHQFSAVCPHKGCLVAWNSAEQTWDCPCHGSRYARTGRVLSGPSIADLQREE